MKYLKIKFEHFTPLLTGPLLSKGKGLVPSGIRVHYNTRVIEVL